MRSNLRSARSKARARCGSGMPSKSRNGWNSVISSPASRTMRRHRPASRRRRGNRSRRSRRRRSPRPRSPPASRARSPLIETVAIEVFIALLPSLLASRLRSSQFRIPLGAFPAEQHMHARDIGRDAGEQRTARPPDARMPPPVVPCSPCSTRPRSIESSSRTVLDRITIRWLLAISSSGMGGPAYSSMPTGDALTAHSIAHGAGQFRCRFAAHLAEMTGTVPPPKSARARDPCRGSRHARRRDRPARRKPHALPRRPRSPPRAFRRLPRRRWFLRMHSGNRRGRYCPRACAHSRPNHHRIHGPYLLRFGRYLA